MAEAPDDRRPMSLDEAIAMAVLFQKAGHLDQAADLYRQIRHQVPDHADVLHYSGILAHQQGRHDEAIDLIERSLALTPGNADAYSNLGIVLKSQGRVEDAIAAFGRALVLEPRHTNAQSNLGVLYRAQGRFAEAEAAYRAVLAIDPEHIDAWHNLGVLLGSTKRTKEAVLCYCKVTTLSPHHPQARRLLALAYCTIGRRDKAVEIFGQWLQEAPDNPVARHLLAACSGEAVPARAADAFVETTFDQFAASFESKLKQLSYRAPTLVQAMLADAGLPESRQLVILDAGCGTGLCGPLVAPYARRLVGVDLSAGMLDQARGKGVYDELVKEELTAFVTRHRSAFDVILSADTLCYFGSLEAVAEGAARSLTPGGWLVFTVEEAVEDAAPDGYVLETHGRYAHTARYITEVLRRAGLTPTLVRAELRMESGVPVAGLVVRAVKQDAGEGALYSAEAQDHHG